MGDFVDAKDDYVYALMTSHKPHWHSLLQAVLAADSGKMTQPNCTCRLKNSPRDALSCDVPQTRCRRNVLPAPIPALLLLLVQVLVQVQVQVLLMLTLLLSLLLLLVLLVQRRQ